MEDIQLSQAEGQEIDGAVQLADVAQKARARTRGWEDVEVLAHLDTFVKERPDSTEFTRKAEARQAARAIRDMTVTTTKAVCEHLEASCTRTDALMAARRELPSEVDRLYALSNTMTGTERLLAQAVELLAMPQAETRVRRLSVPDVQNDYEAKKKRMDFNKGDHFVVRTIEAQVLANELPHDGSDEAIAAINVLKARVRQTQEARIPKPLREHRARLQADLDRTKEFLRTISSIPRWDDSDTERAVFERQPRQPGVWERNKQPDLRPPFVTLEGA